MTADAAPAAGSLRDYFVLEARHAPRRASLVAAIAGVLVVLGTHALLLRVPEQLIRFLERAFRVQGMASVLLINDLLATYFVAYFVALVGLLDATVVAREEDRLEILLAKPIRARVLLAARAAPSLLMGAGAGAVIAICTALAVAPHRVAGDMISVLGALGAGLALVALAAVLLSALLPALVRMRDGFHALLVASIVWIAPLMPTAAFMYRPDAFEAHPGLEHVIVLASLLWNDATSAWLGPAALALAIPVAAISIAAAGVLLERSDAR
jgi:ABC-type Na+ efflux pump permease subunit